MRLIHLPPPLFHLRLMDLITPIPQTPQYQKRHRRNSHCRSPCQHPSQPLHLTLRITIQRHANLIIEFGDLAIARLLLHANGHAAVIEHSFQVFFQGLGFLRGALGEDVVGVLEVGELGAGFGGGGFAGVEDFGAEFGAGGAEEVGFLFIIS